MSENLVCYCPAITVLQSYKVNFTCSKFTCLNFLIFKGYFKLLVMIAQNTKVGAELAHITKDLRKFCFKIIIKTNTEVLAFTLSCSDFFSQSKLF